MFGYKSVMHLGALSNVSTDGMELNQFSYFFSQAMDEQGKPQGEVRAGTLQMTFANLPSAAMMEWMVNPRKFKEGVVFTYNTENTLLQKISFSSAACVGMKLHYEESGDGYCATSLTVKAKKIVLAETVVENNWKNI